MESFLSQELNNGSHIFEVTQAINLTWTMIIFIYKLIYFEVNLILYQKHAEFQEPGTWHKRWELGDK